MLSIPGMRAVRHRPLEPRRQTRGREEVAGGTDSCTQRLRKRRNLRRGGEGGRGLRLSVDLAGCSFSVRIFTMRKNLRQQVGALGPQGLQQLSAARTRISRSATQGRRDHQLGNPSGQHAQGQGELAPTVQA